MIFCPKCGSQLEDNAKFCNKCGANIGEVTGKANPEKTSSEEISSEKTSSEFVNSGNASSSKEEKVEAVKQPIPQPQPQSQSQSQQQSQSQAKPASGNGDHTGEFDAKDVEENKLLALATYALSALGIIIAIISKKDSPYLQFHITQGIKIAICQAIIALANFIPALGQLIFVICELILVVVVVISFVNTAKGKSVEPAIIKDINSLK